MTSTVGESETVTVTIERLRQLIDESVEARVLMESHRAEKAEAKIEELRRLLRQAEHQIQLLVNRLYGRSSEKIDPSQLLLFREEEAGAPSQEGDERTVEVPGHRRRPSGHGRDSFPEDAKRNRIELEPSETERVCPICDNPLCRIGEDISEKGHYIPGTWEVNEYVRGKWVCKQGHGGVLMAPAPAGVVDKSRFEPSVYAQVATAKYGDHLPLHRQEQIHARNRIPLSRSTMCDMMRDLAILFRVVLQEMKRQVLASRIIQTDDTPVDVLVNRGGPKNKRRKIQGRIWVYIALGGRVVFDFSLSRARDGPVSFLKGFRGYLQGDKYSGYDYLALRDGITKVGCWAHVRRKYVEALDADRKRSAFMVWLIGWLYRIESMLKARRARDPSYDDERTLAARKRLAHHVLDKIHVTIKGYEKDPDVLPKSPLGQAVSYTLNQWDDLKVYPDDLELVPDNNASERALRAVAIGRKNYLFMGSPQGGKTAAVLYSLIGTCKALHLNPYAYLLDVTERLVRDRSTPPVELTPWAWRDARKQQGDATLDEVAAEAMNGVEERETVAAGAGD